MRRGLERALDECLSQLNTGELGLEEVLARYPEHEAELRPLLRTAMLVGRAPRAVPSLAAKAAGRQQLLAAVAKKRREKAQARPGLVRRLGQSAAILVRPWLQPQRQPLRLAQAIAAVLVVVSLISAGTVGVAAGSLPDSPLYTIKRAAERVQLALTTTPAGKARLRMSYSQRRLEETQTLWEAGKGFSETTLQAIESENGGALTAIDQTSDEERLNLLGDFTLLTERQQVTLEEIKPGMPPAEQEAVEEALQASEEHQSVATEAMAEPDLGLKTSPTPRPTDTAAPVAPGLPAAPVPTDTPVPPTFTPIPVPTATPVPPTATPVPPTATLVPPTATPTPQAKVTFGPTMEPEPTFTPESEAPFHPTVVAPTVEPAPTATATVEPTPTATTTATATAAPTPTPIPTATPTPMPPAQPTPTPQAEAPFQPMPASLVTNYRVSDAPQGGAVAEFPAGTATVYIVFDYAYMAGEQVEIRVYDNLGNVLSEEVRTLSGDGTESITFATGEGGFAAGRYLVNIYQGGGLVKTIIWDVVK